MIPDVLFLKDVRISQPLQYLEQTCDSDYVDYTSLPEYFTGLDSWPKHTNLQCCNCDLSFRGIPWFISLNKSYRIIDKVQKGVMDVHRVFCSPFCAVWYVNNVTDSKIINKWDVMELLREFCSLVMGKRVEHIPEAPSKYTMIQYVGIYGITAQDYRDILDKLWDEIVYKAAVVKSF